MSLSSEQFIGDLSSTISLARGSVLEVENVSTYNVLLSSGFSMPLSNLGFGRRWSEVFASTAGSTGSITVFSRNFDVPTRWQETAGGYLPRILYTAGSSTASSTQDVGFQIVTRAWALGDDMSTNTGFTTLTMSLPVSQSSQSILMSALSSEAVSLSAGEDFISLSLSNTTSGSFAGTFTFRAVELIFL